MSEEYLFLVSDDDDSQVLFDKRTGKYYKVINDKQVINNSRRKSVIGQAQVQ